MVRLAIVADAMSYVSTHGLAFLVVPTFANAASKVKSPLLEMLVPALILWVSLLTCSESNFGKEAGCKERVQRG